MSPKIKILNHENKMKLLIYALILLCSHSKSAEIKTQKSKESNSYIIAISGPIENNDFEIFVNKSFNIKNAIVLLDSSGGAVYDSIKIGREIRKKGFYTAVPDNTLCASSCALIWLAGKKRFAEDGSFLGFHAAYTHKNGIISESGAGNALIGSYLNDLGLSDRAIIFVTNAPPEGIERLDQEKAELVGIIYGSVKNFTSQEHTSPSPSIPFRRTDAGITATPHDPVATVTRFYKALSVADANLASALVVPQKRGIGPFNEKNIASFFGSMREPLAIQSIEKISPNRVQVRYTYRMTITQCMGIATVQTEYILGNTLIASIKSNC